MWASIARNNHMYFNYLRVMGCALSSVRGVQTCTVHFAQYVYPQRRQTMESVRYETVTRGDERQGLGTPAAMRLIG